jgi:hypothetical protein
LFILPLLTFFSLQSAPFDPQHLIKEIINYSTDYKSCASQLDAWDGSEESIHTFFTALHTEIEPYRYVSTAHQKALILEAIAPLGPEIQSDVSLLIDTVITFLKDLKIQYHDIQHTLEVVLGTTRAAVQGYEDGILPNPQSAFLPIVAALFHDIGYSNAAETKQWMLSLPRDVYASLFCKIQGESFLQEFEKTKELAAHNPNAIGAELHLYHVHFSQVLLPYILEQLPDTFIHKSKLLDPNSLEIICAIISLTDVKSISIAYRKERRDFLKEKGLSFAGECLATSDLFTQLATVDRLHKALGLYQEFVIGKDTLPWKSGMALLATMPSFYENFAKNCFNADVLSALDRYFAKRKEANPYRVGISYNFFLHEIFAKIYPKLGSFSTITDHDVYLLQGLEMHGLQKEAVSLFLATKYLQENAPLPTRISYNLETILEIKGSFLEITLGEEARFFKQLSTIDKQ